MNTNNDTVLNLNSLSNLKLGQKITVTVSGGTQTTGIVQAARGGQPCLFLLLENKELAAIPHLSIEHITLESP